MAAALRKHRTTIEPLIELVEHVLGTMRQHKDLPLQGLDDVRTCLSLTTLTAQIAMIVIRIQSQPRRTVSIMVAART